MRDRYFSFHLVSRLYRVLFFLIAACSVCLLVLANHTALAGKLYENEANNTPPAQARPYSPPQAAVQPLPPTDAKWSSLKQYRPHTVVFYAEPGSLHQNLKRILADYGWNKLIWNTPDDYMWVGRTRIEGDNLSAALAKLLENYPVQAVFYHGNHVVAVGSRTLK